MVFFDTKNRDGEGHIMPMLKRAQIALRKKKEREEEESESEQQHKETQGQHAKPGPRAESKLSSKDQSEMPLVTAKDRRKAKRMEQHQDQTGHPVFGYTSPRQWTIGGVVAIVVLSCLIALVPTTKVADFTQGNWDELTAGKNVFVAFMSAGCHHCEKMKPAWRKLTAEYQGHTDVVVGEADCKGAGTELCQTNFVNSFPTLKYGNPHDMALYDNYEKDGRSYEVLKAFIGECFEL